MANTRLVPFDCKSSKVIFVFVPESIEDHEVEQDADEGADHVTGDHHHPIHHPLGAVPHLSLSALIAPEVEAEDKIMARVRYFSQFYSLKLTLN